MRVLYIHQYFNTPEGSVGTRSYEMSRRLLEQGHQVTMICGVTARSKSGLTSEFVKGQRRGLVDGINVIEFCLPYSNYHGLLTRTKLFFIFALKTISLALTLEYDVLFATTTPLTAAIPGIVMKIIRKKPFVFEVRDLWPELPRAMGVIKNPLILKALDILEWTAYHSADSLIGLSPGIVKGIEKRNISPSKITMIPNGSDIDIFSPVHKKKKCSIDGIKEDDFIALFCGAHGMANGLDAVLDAANVLVRRKQDKIKLVFIGDGKLKPLLQERAAREGLLNCLFLPPIPKKELASVTASSDVGLMILSNVPAFCYGTSPNKFFDYIASGIPVLNNYSGWLADIINEHQCGIAVKAGDAEAFADALIYFQNNSEVRQTMGKNARILAENLFNRDKLAKEFVTWLEAAYERYYKIA